MDDADKYDIKLQLRTCFTVTNITLASCITLSVLARVDELLKSSDMRRDRWRRDISDVFHPSRILKEAETNFSKLPRRREKFDETVKLPSAIPLALFRHARFSPTFRTWRRSGQSSPFPSPSFIFNSPFPDSLSEDGCLRSRAVV